MNEKYLSANDGKSQYILKHEMEKLQMIEDRIKLGEEIKIWTSQADQRNGEQDENKLSACIRELTDHKQHDLYDSKVRYVGNVRCLILLLLFALLLFRVEHTCTSAGLIATVNKDRVYRPLIMTSNRVQTHCIFSTLTILILAVLVHNKNNMVMKLF